jgi:cold shock CspA family protein
MLGELVAVRPCSCDWQHGRTLQASSSEFCIAIRPTPLGGEGLKNGTMKRHITIKGFGFIVQDSGRMDVVLYASALHRAGVTSSTGRQRVFVCAAEGGRGPDAASIQLA